MLPNPHIVLAGGGSLGTLHPAIALAEAIQDRFPQVELSFIGAGGALERHTAQAAGMNVLSIAAHGAPRSLLDGVRFVSANTAGYCAARWMLSEMGASMVIGMGGPVSAVVSYAACSRRTPLVLIEANAAPSHAARRLGAAAEAVCLAFDETQTQLPVNSRIAMTGLPVRRAFTRGGARPQRGANEPRLLTVLAGSSGPDAMGLNQNVLHALASRRAELADWSIVHQAGEGNLRAVEDLYRTHGIDAVVVTQVDEVASLLRETDLAITRAGGSILAELAALGVPAIVAPDTHRTDASQAANARRLHEAGACLMVEPGDATPLAPGIGAALDELLGSQLRRSQLSSRVLRWSKPSAAEAVADICAAALGLERLAAAA